MSVARMPTPDSRQRGVVLVVSLLMLLVLTLIGLAATRSTTLEQRMTANQNDQAVAFEAAEAALRDGESALSGATALNYAGNTAGAYTDTTMTVNWKTINWDPQGGATIAYSGGIQPTPYIRPSYFIVSVNGSGGSAPGTSLSSDAPLGSTTNYYIYARGVGLTGNTSVILESVYTLNSSL